MNIAELVIIIDKKLKIDIAPDNKTYMVAFPYVEISEGNGNILSSQCGRGKTIESATKDYARKLRGQTIVINAFRNNRMELKMPKTLKGY